MAIYEEDWEDGTLANWIVVQDEGDFNISNVGLSNPLNGGSGSVTDSSYIFEKGDPISVNAHGDTSYVFSSGNAVDNSGESTFTFESGIGLGGGGGSGQRALRSVETTGGSTSGITAPNSDYSGFDGGWTYDLLIYHEEVPQTDFQTWTIKPVSNSSGGTNVGCELGYDGNFNTLDFSLRGSLIDSSGSKSKSEWKSQTWYRIKIKHNGSGGYSAKEWQPENESEPAYEISATGSAPNSFHRPALQVNGASGGDLTLDMAYLKIA